MVNSKKMNKSTVAVIVLALLLVLSLVLTATGAWFTDKASDSADKTFGTLKLKTVSLDNVAVANTIDTANVKLMPGSTISGDIDVENIGDSAAWLRYKIEFTGEGAEYLKNEQGEALSSEYVYVADALAGTTKTTIAVSAKVPAEVKNVAQGKTVTITVTVEALQQANTDATNSATIWEGITVEETTHA